MMDDAPPDVVEGEMIDGIHRRISKTVLVTARLVAAICLLLTWDWGGG